MTELQFNQSHRLKTIYLLGIFTCLALAAILTFFNPRTPPIFAAQTVDLTIYNDALASGWQDWSWDATRSFANPSPVHTGNASISVTYTKAWAGLYLHSAAPTSTAEYDLLRFWIHGGSAGGQTLRVVANTDGSNTFAVNAQTKVWTKIDVPLSDLGNPTNISDLYWQDATGGAQPTFYLDDIAVVNSGLPTPTSAPPGSGPALSVVAGAGVHSISPYIYGMNFADQNLATELRLPVSRWGGNGTTRYNWRQDASNHASDWYFENLPNDNLHPELLPDGSASDLFVEQIQCTNTQTLRGCASPKTFIFTSQSANHKDTVWRALRITLQPG